MSTSFTKLKPTGQVDFVEEALDSLNEHTPDEWAAARRVLEDSHYTSTQIAEVFRGMGFAEVTAPRVRHYRRKMKEGRA